MTREKKEKLYKQIESNIYLWIQKTGWFYWRYINYMCIDIARTYNCSPHFVKKVFWELLKKDKSFKKWLSDFEI